MLPNHIIVINVAGLSPLLVAKSDIIPNITNIIRSGSFAPLYPVFPAVTSTAQASLTTGVYPSEHGIVANSFFELETQEVHFWHQSDKLINGERFWTKLRKKIPELTVATLWWQNSKFSDAEIIVTPAPIHTETGEMIPTCYSKPYNLYTDLEKLFGIFPLHHYWGPLASIESGKWIAKATKYVVEHYKPTITLTYIPHLDYSLQRFGSNSPEVTSDLKGLDTIIGEISESAKKINAKIVILSEYGMSEVTDAIHINRELRKAKLLSIREVKSKEYIELGDSTAFAMVDHQVAHIYLKDSKNRSLAGDVIDIIKNLDKDIELISTDEEKAKYHINNKRSGDIIAIAPSDKWFSYYWWLDNEKAPTFAYTVDIHRKPGYDPLELFFGETKKGISMNTKLIKASHGRLPINKDEFGIFISSLPIVMTNKNTPYLKAIDVPTILTKLITD